MTADTDLAALLAEHGEWFATGCEDADPTVELLLEDDHSTSATVLHAPEAER